MRVKLPHQTTPMKYSTAIDIPPLVLRSVAALMLAVFIHPANATEVYKWTDANGQIHFGDRLSAPANGKKIDVKSQPTSEPTEKQRGASKPPQTNSQPPSNASPSHAYKGKGKPVDPSRVAPSCQDLIDQISRVKAGVNWQSLYQKFDATCPGISYECNTYRTHPENNQCTWIERRGSNVMQTNNYE